MACEPLSVLVLSTCLIAFWPCILPLCFAVPILPYPVYYMNNTTQDGSASNETNEKNKICAVKKKECEPTHEKEVKEVEEVPEEIPDRNRPSKGSLVPKKKRKRTKPKFDGREEDCLSCDTEEEFTIISCKDKNIGRDIDFDLECDLCGRYRASIYYDSGDDCGTETEVEEIIVRSRKKPKMVNKYTKTNKKITKNRSRDMCCCNKKFGRAIRKEEQLTPSEIEKLCGLKMINLT